jgi:hypothetical protein
MPRKKRKTAGYYYQPTPKDWEAFRYCVRNNIRISMLPQEQGMYPENFKVTVSMGSDYKKWNESPQTYNITEIQEQVFKACNYYYDKYRK